MPNGLIIRMSIFLWHYYLPPHRWCTPVTGALPATISLTEGCTALTVTAVFLCFSCKSGEQQAEGCTPVTGALPATISLEVDEDREMERLHYLVISNQMRLDRLSELILQQAECGMCYYGHCISDLPIRHFCSSSYSSNS